MKKILLFLLLFSATVSGQRQVLKPLGVQKQNKEILPAVTKRQLHISKISAYDQVLGVSGIIDTLRHLPSSDDLAWNTNFGFWGQDVMLQWFEAPADMHIKGIGFRSSDDEGPDVSVNLVEINWTREQLSQSDITRWGYYHDSSAINGVAPFAGNDPNPLQWIDTGGSGAESPVGQIIWPVDGQKASVKVNIVEEDVSWISVNDSGFGPFVPEAGLIGVAIKNDSPEPDHYRHGLFASTSGTGVPGFKFYINGRFSWEDSIPNSETWGWWTREYHWNISLEVLLTGNRAPYIEKIFKPNVILWNDSTEIAAIVTDDNPSGGPAGVEEVMLFYRLESDTTWHFKAMDSSGDSLYKAIIPPIGHKDTFTFFIRATDISAEKRYSASQDIVVFQQQYNTLLVFNGFEDPTGFPQDYYFGPDGILQFDYDVWSFDELNNELIQNYQNIIEIATKGVTNDNTRVIDEWIKADPAHNYMVAGDEYLGAYCKMPCGPIPYEPGLFFRDVLGITVHYQDIVRSSSEKTSVRFVEGSLLGDASFQYLKDLSIPADSVYYDPRYHLNIPNWLDGFEITEDSESFLEADSGGGYGSGPPVLSIGHSRTLPAGNKIAFLGYDPLSIHSGWDEESPVYNWLGFSKHAPQVQVLNWFGIATSIKNEEKPKSPSGFSLHQNYPNPFNPSTVIEYSVGAYRNTPLRVTLKIYDVLGRPVKTLVDKKQPTGTYRVTFDASDLASGIYYYRLTVGTRHDVSIITRKMLLLK